MGKIGMKTGMLFTFLVSFIVFMTAVLLAVYMFKHKEPRDKKMSAYAWFWLITACLWFFASFRVLFGRFGMNEIDRTFFEIDQFFVFISPIPLFYYLFLKIFNKESLAKWVAVGVAVISAVAIFLLFKYGITEGKTTYFTTKFEPHRYAFTIFAAMAVSIIFLSGIDVLKMIIKHIKKAPTTDGFFYSLAILVYLLIGVFDEQGLIAGWPLVFFRLSYLSAFLIVYLSFSEQLSKKEIAIKEKNTNELQKEVLTKNRNHNE